MALTKAFYEAVKSGNVRRVRIMMQDSLLVDPTFTEFNAMEKATESMKGLYDEHDGKEFIEDRNLWNDEYMDKVMVKVLSNFSHERIDHLKDVVRYLRPVTKTVTSKSKQINNKNNYDFGYHVSYREEKRHCQERGDYLGAKIGVGAVAGAAVGGVIISIAGASTAGVIGGIAVGAVVGGVTTNMIVNTDKNNE